MKATSAARHAVHALTFAAILNSFGLAQAAPRSFAELSEGPALHLKSGQLPSDVYVAVKVRKLRNPKLAWLNVELLRDWGFEIGPVLAPEQRAAILDALAWVVPDRFADPAIYTDEERIMWADKYGGTGIGLNKGSARALIAGLSQMKGSGITPLAHSNDPKKTARSSTHESIKDGVWGEFTNAELPEAGNRLIAIIDRGPGVLEDGESQMIEVRENPLRSGHFVKRAYGYDEADKTRAKKAIARIDKSLPQAKALTPAEISALKKPERIARGLIEYAERVGRQYGAQHMLRVYHGATSQSNIEIDGRALDFGTASTQPGHAQIYFLDFMAEYGSEVRGEVADTLITGVVDEVLETLTPTLKRETVALLNKILPPAASDAVEERLVLAYHAAFERQAKREALLMTGIPESHVDPLLEKHGELARRLVLLTKDSGPAVNLKTAKNLDSISESALVLANRAVAELKKPSKAAIREALSKIDAVTDTAELSRQWSELLKDSYSIAKADGVKADAFRELVRLNAIWRNRSLKDLYLPSLRKITKAANAAYLKGDEGAIQRSLESVADRVHYKMPELSGYQAPLEYSRDRQAGETSITAYNAVTGRYERVITSRLFARADQTGRELVIEGRLFGEENLERLAFNNSTRKLSVIATVLKPSEANDAFVKIVVPLEAPTDEVRLVAPSGSRALPKAKPNSFKARSCSALFKR